MLNLQLAKKYAKAIFEIAQDEDKLQEYGQEIADVAGLIQSQAELHLFLSDPQVEPGMKKQVLQDIFQTDVSEDVRHFLMLLIDRRRISLLVEINALYQQLSNQARGIVIADVTTAQELSEAQADGLQQKLQQVTERKVKLRRHIMPAIIGGVVIRIGDRRVDGSVRGSLQSLRGTLLK
jgi:F-type H+-transporting ATPase subunit delta